MAFMFLKDRDDERAASAKERTQFLADRQQDRMLWENHLSKTVAVLQKLVDEIEEHRRWSDGDHRRWTDKA